MVHDIGYVPYSQIVPSLPINSGDTLYVISDVLRLSKESYDNGDEFICEIFIKSLQEKVGETGTLLFPVFNWDYCKGVAFDYYKTKGKTGALGNAALKMPGFKRTRHPIYSFAVWGKAQDSLVSLDNKSSFGSDSPFGYLHKNKANSLVIGLSATKANTFVHYIEQAIGVDYRYEKDFNALYTNEEGVTKKLTYSMYVRDLDMNPIFYDKPIMSDIMSALGISRSFTANNVQFHMADLCGMFEIYSLEIRYNKANNIYEFMGR